MGFKRAEWHSGLTYQQTCENCNTTVQYMDDKLDFRPWYPDGFVYCPKCKTPMRHSEKLAINAPVEETVVVELSQSNDSIEKFVFCPWCGKKFKDEDVFCAGCGKKR